MMLKDRVTIVRRSDTPVTDPDTGDVYYPETPVGTFRCQPTQGTTGLSDLGGSLVLVREFRLILDPRETTTGDVYEHQEGDIFQLHGTDYGASGTAVPAYRGARLHHLTVPLARAGG
ncbi:hypothetical protein [Isoptericola sp. NPDC055881]